MIFNFLFLIFSFFSLMFITSEGIAGKLREKQIAAHSFSDSSSKLYLNGKKLYTKKLCYTCHGIEGRHSIISSYPILNGQKNNYLLQQMMDIRDGKRNNGMSSMMRAVTLNVSDAEMVAIANYLSCLSAEKKDMRKQIISVSNGKKLYKNKLCHTCHGANGRNPVSNYPILAGQNKDYLIQQIIDIKNKKRINGMSNAMSPFLGLVSNEDLKEISKYLASLN